MPDNTWKIVFMGTAEVSEAVFSALIEGPDRVVAAVSQPDRPVGRGRKVKPTPVRLAAERAGIPIRQPQKMKNPEFLDWLRSLDADLFVVAAFGRILKPEILQMPRHGCINVHISLLPKYRGAAPIQWAVANDEKNTGITIMMMDQGMDTGDTLLARETEIGPEETAEELTPRLSHLGGELVLEAISGYKNGELVPKAQDHSQATLAPILKKEDGLIDWGMPAKLIAARTRGFTPWPGTYTHLEGLLLKVLKSKALDRESDAAPGTVVQAPKGCIHVSAGQGVLSIERLQLEGKKPLDAQAFLTGRPLKPGIKLG